MSNKYWLIKVINLIYVVIQFVFLYISSLMMNGKLYRNGWSIFFSYLIFVIVIIVGLGINLIIVMGIKKEDSVIIKRNLIWCFLPLLAALIHLFAIL